MRETERDLSTTLLWMAVKAAWFWGQELSRSIYFSNQLSKRAGGSPAAQFYRVDLGVAPGRSG